MVSNALEKSMNIPIVLSEEFRDFITESIAVFTAWTVECTQCDHFQQFYNRRNVKVHVPIIRWSHFGVPLSESKLAILQNIIFSRK